MKLQLFLSNNEVELDDVINFPLIKTFEELNSPTSICVEYSKSINIPRTKQNDILFGSIFSIDKRIASGSINAGLSFDPTKKIPMKIIYNASVLLEGYAKFLTIENTHYTINLFGQMGQLFQDLLNIKPKDLDSHLDGHYLNLDTIEQCWTTQPNITNWNISDIVTFAPTYRGFYNDFNSNNLQDSTTTSTTIDEYLKLRYTETLRQRYPALTDDEIQTMVDDIDIQTDGLKDYQMKQYDITQLKPGFYISYLFKMFQEKLPLISDYKLVLDNQWFNVNNPYYTHLCYMLDYIVQEGTKVTMTYEIDSPKPKLSKFTSNDYNQNITGRSVTSVDIENINGDVIELQAYNLYILQSVLDNSLNGRVGKINIKPNTKFRAKLGVYRGLSLVSNEEVIIFGADEENKYNITKTQGYVTDDGNFIPDTQWLTLQTSLFLPNTKFIGDFQDGDDINITIECISDVDGPYEYSYYNGVRYRTISSQININNTVVDSIKSGVIYDNNLYINTTTINNIPLTLDLLYKQDKPLFNIILEYTKQYGLVWDIDYKSKELKVLTKNSFFKDYSIEDWTDKLDKSSKWVITPVIADSQSFIFNYNKINGFRYTGYEDKYGTQYGTKTLKTEYEFYPSQKELFTDIDPIIISSRSYTTLNTLANWDIISPIEYETDNFTRIEDADEDDEKAINLNNWVFRTENQVNTPLHLFLPTPYMEDNKSCYIHPDFISSLDARYIRPLNTIPEFSSVYNNYGSIFSAPMEDYTSDTQLVRATGNYQFDLFWEKFIYERYNIQNKKIMTCFNLSLMDYINFKFNKFIMIENQLYCVNKINEFNLVSGGVTEVELIQISDISAYTQGQKTFPFYSITPDAIYIDASTEQTPNNIFFNITINTSTLITEDSIEITKSGPGNISVYTISKSGNTNTITFRVTGMMYTEDTMYGTIKILSDEIPFNILGAGQGLITSSTPQIYETTDAIKTIYLTSDPVVDIDTVQLIEYQPVNYGSVYIDDIYYDEENTVGVDIIGTHVQGEKFIGGLRASNIVSEIEVPIEFDCTSHYIESSTEGVIINDGTYSGDLIISFTSQDRINTIYLEETMVYPEGVTSIEVLHQDNNLLELKFSYNGFNVRGIWKGSIYVSNGYSDRRIPIKIYG